MDNPESVAGYVFTNAPAPQGNAGTVFGVLAFFGPFVLVGLVLSIVGAWRWWKARRHVRSSWPRVYENANCRCSTVPVFEDDHPGFAKLPGQTFPLASFTADPRERRDFEFVAKTGERFTHLTRQEACLMSEAERHGKDPRNAGLFHS